MSAGKSPCPQCGGSGYAYGGKVGDYAQGKIEKEIDDAIEEDDDDEDERKVKRGFVDAGVSLAREAIGAAIEFHKGGEVVDYRSFSSGSESRGAQLRRLLTHHMKRGK